MAAVTLYVPKVSSRSSNIVLPIEENDDGVRVLVVGRLDGKKRGLGGKKWMERKTLRANYVAEQYTTDEELALMADYRSSVIRIDGESYLPVSLIRHRQLQPEPIPQPAPSLPDLFTSASTARIEDLLTQILDELRLGREFSERKWDELEERGASIDKMNESNRQLREIMQELSRPSPALAEQMKSAGIELAEVIGSPIGNNDIID